MLIKILFIQKILLIVAADKKFIFQSSIKKNQIWEQEPRNKILKNNRKRKRDWKAVGRGVNNVWNAHLGYLL